LAVKKRMLKEATMNDKLELEVFKTGDYGPKGTWDEAALDRLAADYNPTLHEAPVTVDHAQRGPALGWVESLRRAGDRLVARLCGLNGRLLELIRAGAFKKRSVEIYPKLRESGRPYLRAVSFLGAASPEVKGLTDPELPEAKPLFGEESDDHLSFELETPAAMAETGDEEASEQGDQTSVMAFAELRDRLQASGRWQPAWTERGIAEFWRALAAVDEIEVGDGQTVNAAEWFARFLEELPPVVTLGETAPGGGLAPEATLPRGENVDPGSIALHRRVVAFMEEHAGVDYGEALRRVAR
jgi:hypothetical protein